MCDGTGAARITNPVAILGILSVVVGGMIWLERFRSFKKLRPAAASILLATRLSNAGIPQGVAVGILGVAVGYYLGLVVGSLMRFLL